MKKIVLGGLALFVVAGSLIGFNRLCSITGMGVDYAQTKVDEAIPVEVLLKELDFKLKSLDPKIKSSKVAVARADVKVERLQADVDELTASVKKQWDNIVDVRKAIPTDTETQFVSVGGKKYTLDEVETKLDRQLTVHDASVKSLNAQKSLLNSGQKELAAERKQLDSLLDLKVELKAKIEEIKARLTTVKAKQVETSSAYVDDATLEETQKLLDEADRRVAEQEKLLEYEAEGFGAIEAASEKRNVLEEIDARRAEEAVRGEDGELINIR
ncbi:coiled-coil domain-containing protein [Thalassoroseus pseudoceratinae]|uniref:hypothetical protein n=1 Tax=Thalassoroseus pseudoceratinae TaxID=2713176 RepID=UPI0014204B71|nr:hypothetical protein [Thalassoroseus pseudoceratinae]